MKPSELRVKAKATEDTEVSLEGEYVEGYLNSWHLAECWTMQVEGSGGVDVEGCSGIFIMNVAVDINTLGAVGNEA